MYEDDEDEDVEMTMMGRLSERINILKNVHFVNFHSMKDVT